MAEEISLNKADKSKLIAIDIGVFNPLTGKSNQEIAALSRSRHQSQGFGSTGTRGEEVEYLEHIKGEPSSNQKDIFDGIDVSWNRVKNGKEIGNLIQKIEQNFNFSNPSASIPNLIEVYKKVQKLEDKHWREIKLEELKNIILACSGLFIEAVAQVQSATPGSTLKVKLEAVNRSPFKITIQSIETFPHSNPNIQSIILENNKAQFWDIDLKIDENQDYTAPYWLKEQGTDGMYSVNNQENIGLPDIIRTTKVIFNLSFNDIIIPVEREVIYKYNDEVKGEVYKPFDIVPAVTTSILDKVKIFNSQSPKSVGVKIKSGQDNLEGFVYLNASQEWKIVPDKIAFSIAKKGDEKTVYFEITPPVKSDEIEVSSYAIVNQKKYTKELITIQYDHINQQQVLLDSKAKFNKLDIQIKNEKIAYLMGAGDEVPVYLSQMGYEVTLIKPEEITLAYLNPFQTVIIGIRAYNTVNELAYKQEILFEFVKNGGTLIVQYNTTGKLTVKELAPYPLKISRDRVTQEDAPVTLLEPEHKALNFPNKITSKDFTGWVQEQGLYYPDEWDERFVPLIASNDYKETPKKGALLIANYGKGYYIYTGLSFFRELPAGVSGAYRLFSNLISLGTKP
jgi:hypothetical protein